MSAEFVACLADALDLYAEPPDPKGPKVCFDETSKQLVAEARAALPAEPGRLRRYDYEYRRNGVRNRFMFFEPPQGWRHVAVPQRRAMADFALRMRWLADPAYPQAQVIRVVRDNPVSSTGPALNTHRPAALYATLAPAAARRILRRLEFHYTPKHGSWLNLAAMEPSVFSRQCLDRRIPDETVLEQEIQALEHERNQARVSVNWQFSTRDARNKLEHLYPSVSS